MRHATLLSVLPLALAWLITSGCNGDPPDDPWLKPKVVRIMRPSPSQQGPPPLVAYCSVDPEDPGIRHWLTSTAEAWPIDFNQSESLSFELVTGSEPMDAETLHTTFGSEFGPSIVHSTRSVDEGEQTWP